MAAVSADISGHMQTRKCRLTTLTLENTLYTIDGVNISFNPVCHPNIMDTHLNIFITTIQILQVGTPVLTCCKACHTDLLGHSLSNQSLLLRRAE